MTVIATDPSGAATPQRVVISVEDVNESPAFGKDTPTTRVGNRERDRQRMLQRTRKGSCR